MISKMMNCELVVYEELLCLSNKVCVAVTLAVTVFKMATARVATTQKMLTIRTILNKIKSFVQTKL
jgi:hypothetical protein